MSEILKVMQEYVVTLSQPAEITLILALSLEEAYEIAYYRWGKSRIVGITLFVRKDDF